MSFPTDNFREALPWVLLISFMFFVSYTNRAIFGPILVYVEQELALTHSESTGLILYLSAGFTVSTALSPFLISRISPKTVLALSTCISGLFLLCLSQCESLLSLTVFISLLGLFAGAYMTAAISTMGSLIEPELWTRALAVHELAPAMSFILSPLFVELSLFVSGSWRGAFIGTGVCSIAAGALFLSIAKGGRQKSLPPSWKGAREIVRNPLLWFFAWSFILAVAGEFAPFNVLPLHLTNERGLDPMFANQLLAFSRMAAPAAVVLGGLLTPRLGMANTLRIFFALQGVGLICMGMPWFSVSCIGMFIQPLLPPFVFPVIFSVVTRSFHIRLHPLAFGIGIPIGYCIGVGLIPKLLGLAGDYLSFSTGFLALGAVNIISVPLCRLLRKTNDANNN